MRLLDNHLKQFCVKSLLPACNVRSSSNRTSVMEYKVNICHLEEAIYIAHKEKREKERERERERDRERERWGGGGGGGGRERRRRGDLARLSSC